MKTTRQITEKELKIAAKEIKLQSGVIEYLIKQVRKNQQQSNYDCRKCKNSFSNPFDQYYCTIPNTEGVYYDIEKGEDCGGKLFNK
jgi:hypothetical protein